MKKILNLGLVALLTLLIYCPFVNAQEPNPQSLYKRLGGIHSIAGVVDDFVDRLLTDPVITKNKSVVAALKNITKPGLKYLLTEMVCEASGGPQKYTGKSMKESHGHLNIREAEWQAMVKDFLKSLDKFNVPQKEQDELLAVVGSTKVDIVSQAEPIAQAAPPAPEPKKSLKERKNEPPPPPPAIPGLPGLPGLPTQ